MRFLLEFVSCCGSPTWRASEPTVPSEDEERWLVPAPSVSSVVAAPSRRRKRRTGSMDWRPSLGPISEDIAVPQKKPMNGAVVSSGRDGKKRTVTGGAARAYRRSYSEGHFGSSSMPMIMPAFSPTPFMF